MMEEKPQRLNCPLVATMNMIGGKWKIPILWYLAQAPRRYNELKRCICEITNIMLTRSLRDLEEDGLIERIQHGEIPPHVEYRISKKGLAILPAINHMEEWAKTWLPENNRE